MKNGVYTFNVMPRKNHTLKYFFPRQEHIDYAADDVVKLICTCKDGKHQPVNHHFLRANDLWPMNFEVNKKS